MNFGMVGGPFFLILLWLAGWLFGLYLVLRFLRAIERGVAAHERIADALAKSNREPPGLR